MQHAYPRVCLSARCSAPPACRSSVSLHSSCVTSSLPSSSSSFSTIPSNLGSSVAISLLFSRRYYLTRRSGPLMQRGGGFQRGDALGYGGVENDSFHPSQDLVGEDGVWDDGPSGYEWKSRQLQERRDLALDYLTDIKKRVPIHNAVRTRARLNRERLMQGLNEDTTAFHQYRAMRKGEGNGYIGEEEDAAVSGDMAHNNDSNNNSGPQMVLNEDSPAAVLTEALRASHYNPALDVHSPLGSETAARLAVVSVVDPIAADFLNGGLKAGGGTAVSAGEAISAGRRAVRDAIDLVEEELEELVADEGVLETLASVPPEHLRELRHEFFGGSPETTTSHKDSTDETLREWLRLRKESSQYHSFISVPSDERREWSAWYLRDIRSNRPVEDD